MATPTVAQTPVTTSRPPDLLSLYESLNNLRYLKPNWDSDGGLVIDEQIIHAAKSLLDRVELQGTVPMVVPIGNGSLQLEWHRGSRSVEIEFLDAILLQAMRRDDSSGIREHRELSIADHAPINDLIAWFVT